MSKRLRRVCAGIDKDTRKLLDSHKKKNLVDFAKTHLFDIDTAQRSNLKARDFLKKKEFVDTLLFVKPRKYLERKFSRSVVNDECIKQGFKCDLIQLGPKRILLYTRSKQQYSKEIKAKLVHIKNRMEE